MRGDIRAGKAGRGRQNDIREREGGAETRRGKKRWCDRQRRAEEGRRMKGNLIDEKRSKRKEWLPEKGSTSEAKKCRARPSERHRGISGASLMGETDALNRFMAVEVMTSDKVIMREQRCSFNHLINAVTSPSSQTLELGEFTPERELMAAITIALVY